MQRLNWQRDPNLLMVINVLGTASLLGFLYCLYALLVDVLLISQISIIIYAAWFLTSIVSLYLMRQGDQWGAYALAIATGLIGIYELVNGTATFGGAVLAASVFILVLYYLYRSTSLADDENQSISSTL